MKPLKRIDNETPIGTRVIVVTDDGLFTGATTGRPVEVNGLITVEVSGKIRWSLRVYLLPETSNGQD